MTSVLTGMGGIAGRLRMCPFLLVVLAAAPGCAMSWEENPPSDAAENDGPMPDSHDVQPEEGVCPEGRTDCGGDCIDLSTSHENCGECGNACGDAEVCSEGRCDDACATGLVECSGGCVDIRTDAGHCGACNSACPAGLNADPLCDAGDCALACRSGWSDIDGLPGCEEECTFVSALEVCNGADENCNGLVDEGFDCEMGDEVDCETLCGSTGRGICGVDCLTPEGSSCNPPAETCNDIDDDCDGTVDEGCAVDADGDGYPSDEDCDDGNEDVYPGAAETCNGIDDDCDAAVDDGSGLCTAPPGTCYEAAGTCSGGDCTYPPKPSTATCDDGDTCTTGDHCNGSGGCTGTSADCSRPHTTGGHCSGGACTGWACVSPWSNCNSNWDDGCEIPTGTAARCDRSGLDSTNGCGTAYCGSSGSANAQNFGSWYCIGCSTCHHFADGWSWCLTGDLEWSPDRCASCCNSSFEDLVCGP